MLKGIIAKLDDVKNWDDFIKNGIGGTLFHEKWYLFENNVSYAICIVDKDDNLLAVMPLYNYPGKEIYQSTKLVPYSGPILYVSDKSRENQIICRSIHMKLISLLQKVCNSVCFSLPVEYSDITIFIQNGFIPEVRYTYHLDLSLTSQQLLMSMSRNRQRDIIKSFKSRIQVVINATLIDKESKLTFWCEEEDRYITIKKINRILIEKRGVMLNAVDDDRKNIVGQLFLAWDNKKAYTLFSYYDKVYARQGIATRLYFEAFLFAKEVIKVNTIDLEGSVLNGVEKFYQSFGGKHVTYFNLHWNSNRSKLLEEDFYNYT